MEIEVRPGNGWFWRYLSSFGCGLGRLVQECCNLAKVIEFYIGPSYGGNYAVQPRRGRDIGCRLDSYGSVDK